MKTIFDYTNKTVKDAILVTAKFSEGSHGMLDIYCFESLEFEEQVDDRLHYTVEGGVLVSAGQEPVGYSNRYTEPHSRLSAATYIPHSFDCMDILPTSNKSRFLVLKETFPVSTIFTSSDECPERQAAVILDDEEKLAHYLPELLPRLGVPAEDVEVVKASLMSRLFS